MNKNLYMVDGHIHLCLYIKRKNIQQLQERGYFSGEKSGKNGIGEDDERGLLSTEIFYFIPYLFVIL